ncbi:hypothetical protein ISN45_Aa01g039540, partial [Arabidopsis thaliana x Arabidopsis arenosa]
EGILSSLSCSSSGFKLRLKRCLLIPAEGQKLS